MKTKSEVDNLLLNFPYLSFCKPLWTTPVFSNDSNISIGGFLKNRAEWYVPVVEVIRTFNVKLLPTECGEIKYSSNIFKQKTKKLTLLYLEQINAIFSEYDDVHLC